MIPSPLTRSTKVSWLVNPINLHYVSTPRSGRDAVLGIKSIEGLDEVQACVTAPPDNGKANKALCKLIASELGIAKSKVEVVQGQTSRHKRLALGMLPNPHHRLAFRAPDL